MEWIIGREGDIKIQHPQVSKRHAKLSKNGDQFFLEDLNSTNGTFVNGQQVVKKSVSIGDRIELAGCVAINMSKLIEQMDNSVQGGTDLSKSTIVMIESLKKVYEEYNAKKLSYQTSTITKTMLKRSLPMAIPAVLGVVAIIFGENGKSLAIVGSLISVVGLVWGIVSSSKEQAELPRKMQELDDKFKIDYVCPKCKNFLGFTPWQGLHNKGECTFCKTKWR